MKREFPNQPLVGVGGVLIRGGQVLLIRRAKPPLKGRWTIPGGMVEVGESLVQAIRRELREETGLDVEPMEVVAVLDRIVRKGKRVRYHYVIIDYACRIKHGRLKPGSDVLDARWVRRNDLASYHLTRAAKAVVRRTYAFFARADRSSRFGFARAQSAIKLD